MPAKVQSPPDHTRVHGHGSTKYPDQDPRYGASYKSDSLRLALGSILSPKRPPLSSRSSSGTASPAYSPGFPFPYSSSSPGSQTPNSEVHYADYLLGKVPHSQQHHPHGHGHVHTPSKLARGTSVEDVSVPAPVLPRSSSMPTSSHLSPGEKRGEEPVSPLPESMTGSPSASSAAKKEDEKEKERRLKEKGGKPASGSGTPRATFIQTLEGKNHWDALIHGSFS